MGLLIQNNWHSKVKSGACSLYRLILGNEIALSVVITISIIALGSVIGIENNKIITSNPTQLVHYYPSSTLSFLANWDGVRYISIAIHGYTDQFVTGFFPLYPILVMLLNKIINSPLISLLTVSWISLIGAIYFYIKTIKLYFDVDKNIDALRAVVLFVLFPSGVYLFAGYTESLFAFLSLGAIYFALRKRYLSAALLTLLATATHINGIFLVALIALILFEQKEKIKNILVTCIIGCLGLVGYMIYLWVKFKNPLEFINAQKDHGWLHSSLLSHLGSFGFVNYTFAFLILLSVIYWWKRRKSFAIYSGLYLLIPAIGGQFGGYPRYALMVFPLQFMFFEYFKDKKFGYQIMLVLFAVVWTYTTLQFAAGYVVS